MTDRKTPTKKSRARRTRSKKTFSPFGSRMRSDELILTTAWSTSDLTSSTAGNIASVSAPSLQLSTEASGILTLFTEVRLVSYRIEFGSAFCSATALHSNLYVGTNLQMNYTTNTAPTSLISVVNLTKRSKLFSGSTRGVAYNMYVPKDLLFLPTTTGADVPTLPNPEAGSPGAIIMWGRGFSPSTDMFTGGIAIAKFHLRGRN